LLEIAQMSMTRAPVPIGHAEPCRRPPLAAAWWAAALCLAAGLVLALGFGSPARAQTAAAAQADAGDQGVQCLPSHGPRRPLTPFLRRHRIAGVEPCAPCPPLPRMTMREALDKHLIDVVPCGDGVSTGYSMFMAIKSRVCNPLDIDPTINETMVRNNYDYQDMWAFRAAGEYDQPITTNLAQECTSHAQVEQGMITAGQGVSHHWRKVNSVQLGAYDPKLLILLAYCLQYKRLIPTANITFHPNSREWTPETTRLFNYLALHPNDYTPTVIQLALWAVSEDYSAQQIASTFRFTQQDHTDACTLIGKAGISASKLALCVVA
jgi:hypothetical protein